MVETRTVSDNMGRRLFVVVAVVVVACVPISHDPRRETNTREKRVSFNSLASHATRSPVAQWCGVTVTVNGNWKLERTRNIKDP
jgi:hypothetical protein